MNDLIERLRDGCVRPPGCWTVDEVTTDDLMAEAAAALEAAREDAERLAEALRLAEEHINSLTPEWYSAGQRVLAEIRAAIDQARGKGIVPERGEGS